jgi:hypothetical protein
MRGRSKQLLLRWCVFIVIFVIISLCVTCIYVVCQQPLQTVFGCSNKTLRTNKCKIGVLWSWWCNWGNRHFKQVLSRCDMWRCSGWNWTLLLQGDVLGYKIVSVYFDVFSFDSSAQCCTVYTFHTHS